MDFLLALGLFVALLMLWVLGSHIIKAMKQKWPSKKMRNHKAENK